MTQKLKFIGIAILVVLGMTASAIIPKVVAPSPLKVKVTSTATRTPTTASTSTSTAAATVSATIVATLTSTVGPTFTLEPSATVGATVTTAPSPTTGAFIQPYPSAPACPDIGPLHDKTMFHTIWDGQRGCHYDHEHGDDPDTTAVAAEFPELYRLLGNQWIGNQNPSSPCENQVGPCGTSVGKHEGFKWHVQLAVPEPCDLDFEGPLQTGIKAVAIQFHAYGVYSIEFEARVHSAVFAFTQCRPGNPNDDGTVIVGTHQDYGSRVVPYQGDKVIYPNSPDNDSPPHVYDSARGPYFTDDCVGSDPRCRPDIQFIKSHKANVNSIWSSKPTGLANTQNPFGNVVATLLFRVRNAYQVFFRPAAGFTYPPQLLYVCSNDGGATYDPAACAYNNSTHSVHEIAGNIPDEWDNLAGFDTNPDAGRITAEGLVDQFGHLAPAGVCAQPGQLCFPVYLDDAFTGKYGAELRVDKSSQFSHAAQPSHDIYFCGVTVCTEDSPGAHPSGWIGNAN